MAREYAHAATTACTDIFWTKPSKQTCILPVKLNFLHFSKALYINLVCIWCLVRRPILCIIRSPCSPFTPFFFLFHFPLIHKTMLWTIKIFSNNRAQHFSLDEWIFFVYVHSRFLSNNVCFVRDNCIPQPDRSVRDVHWLFPLELYYVFMSRLYLFASVLCNVLQCSCIQVIPYSKSIHRALGDPLIPYKVKFFSEISHILGVFQGYHLGFKLKRQFFRDRWHCCWAFCQNSQKGRINRKNSKKNIKKN